MNARFFIPALGGGACFFLAGWMLAGPAGKAPAAGGDAHPTGDNSADAGPPGIRQDRIRDLLKSGGGTFQKLVEREKAMAQLKPNDWLALWKDLIRTRDHYPLYRPWTKADPCGALKAALEAAADRSLSEQESYNYQDLGRFALEELIRQDPAAARSGLEDWRRVYKDAPDLMACADLLISGTAEQKDLLLEGYGADAALRTEFAKPGDQPKDMLGVLEKLSASGFQVAAPIRRSLMSDAVVRDAGGAVDWILQQPAGLPPEVLKGALEGFNNRESLVIPQDSVKAMGRLLDILPPDQVDNLAMDYVGKLASFDPEGARTWAKAHVPEAQLDRVLSSLPKPAE